MAEDSFKLRLLLQLQEPLTLLDPRLAIQVLWEVLAAVRSKVIKFR